ncbi:hypothetical protein AZL_a01570 (plasmid) [Azospirillum sp. B510]|uniref:type VI secretion system tube protein Hcp n=1 Tax=Azospirillum sp. (strain B510) TaxID=137722 RepID=UPI0001C4B8E8|nr:type VI secretion system tube protein Hcp [Azospirillum sp. B510]BAI73688.1 hypothetical protein AZL_a01570 [Azospirillum sp. B510]
MRILLKYPGIAGDSLLQGYSNLIFCTKFDMRTGTNDAGSLEYGAAVEDNDYDVYGIAAMQENYRKVKPRSKPRTVGIDSVDLGKPIDMASPLLLKTAFADPVPGAEATIYFLRPIDTQASAEQSGLAGGTIGFDKFLTIVLTDVHVTSYTVSAGTSADNSGDETISLSFTKLNMTYVHYKNGQPQNVPVEIKVAKKK